MNPYLIVYLIGVAIAFVSQILAAQFADWDNGADDLIESAVILIFISAFWPAVAILVVLAIIGGLAQPARRK